MTNRYLLTGAGFSKAFGGLLCDELTAYFFNALAGDKTIQKDILQKLSLKDFEEILTEVRSSNIEKIKTFEKILVRILTEMSENMRINPKESPIIKPDLLEPFLQNFNKIFTLNLDSFVDQYVGKGLAIAGISEGKQDLAAADTSLLDPTAKHYVKLHGSVNWKDDAENIMVLGKNKEWQLENFPLLKKYHDFFTECLSKKNSKLVIIGYSFCDEHINKIIEAAMTKGLEIFIWDPKIKTYLSRYSTGSGPCPDSTPSINKATLEKALRGYLPKNFRLEGDDKNEVKRFLEN